MDAPCISSSMERFACVELDFDKETGRLTKVGVAGTQSRSVQLLEDSDEGALLSSLMDQLANTVTLVGIDLAERLAIPALVRASFFGDVQPDRKLTAIAFGLNAMDVQDLKWHFFDTPLSATSLPILFGTTERKRGIPADERAAAICQYYAAVSGYPADRIKCLPEAPATVNPSQMPDVPWLFPPASPPVNGPASLNLIVAPLADAPAKGPCGTWAGIKKEARETYQFTNGLYNPGFSQMVGCTFSSPTNPAPILNPDDEWDCIASLMCVLQDLRKQDFAFVVPDKRAFRHFVSVRAAAINQPLPEWFALSNREWIRDFRDLSPGLIEPASIGRIAVAKGWLSTTCAIGLPAVHCTDYESESYTRAFCCAHAAASIRPDFASVATRAA